MKILAFMNMRTLTASFALAGVAGIVTSCAERQVEYVPVYRTQPAYVIQQPYPPPAAYPAQPAPVPAPAVAAPAPAPAGTTSDWQASAAAPVPMPAQPAPPPGTTAPPQVVVEAPSAPPPVQVEVVPVSPGPYYVWTPGYWVLEWRLGVDRWPIRGAAPPQCRVGRWPLVIPRPRLRLDWRRLALAIARHIASRGPAGVGFLRTPALSMSVPITARQPARPFQLQ